MFPMCWGLVKQPLYLKKDKMKISEIKLNKKNPRLIKDYKFEKLKKSITEFPKMLELRPIIIDNDNIILGGNMRYQALKDLGYKELPDNWVKKSSELSEEEKQRFVIADNVGFGDWDWDILANEWDSDLLVDWGLDVPSFEVETLQAEEDDYEVPNENEIKTNIVLGDLIEIGEHRLLCGDSTDSDQVAKLMNGNKADMVFTDPPYNVNYEGSNGLKIANDNKEDLDFYEFLYNAFINYEINMKAGSAIYIAHADLEGLNFRKAFKEAGFQLRSTIIWNKNALVMGRSDYHWKHEPILYGWKSGGTHKWKGDRKQTTVWECNKPSRNAEHPTMKPIELVNVALNNSSEINDLILDLFLGSGTTMVASHQLNRNCYGMELEPKYCQVIIDRMLKLDSSLEVKINGKIYNKQ
jgi:DNA modification methylase